MFDVYFSERRDLIVVPKGAEIPPLNSTRKWRKSPRRAIKVSEEIKGAVARQGYYMRRAGELPGKTER